MHIAIDVFATDPKTGMRKKTTRCLIVFVAVDTTGETVPISAWLPESAEDKRAEKYAVQMAELRKTQEDVLIAIDSGQR